MRVSSKMMADNITNNIMKHSQELLKYQTQIVTGKKINKPSDDPVAMGKILDHRRTISKIDQYNRNISRGTPRVDFNEAVLDTVTDLVHQAKSIAADPDLQYNVTLAQEIATIRDQVIQLANSKLNGNYVFSGDQTDTAPFDAAGTYNGDTASKDYLIADNIQISINADGSDIFQGADDVFDSLSDLETALLAQDSTTIQTQVGRLDDVAKHFNQVRADNASKSKRMEITESHWNQFKFEIENILSETENADMAEAAVNLRAAQTAYEASLAASARIIQPNLTQFIR